MQYKKQYFCINVRIQLASTLIAIKLLLDFVVLRLWKCDYCYHHYFKSHQYLYEQMFTCVICVDISISFYLSGFASFFTFMSMIILQNISGYTDEKNRSFYKRHFSIYNTMYLKLFLLYHLRNYFVTTQHRSISLDLIR